MRKVIGLSLMVSLFSIGFYVDQANAQNRTCINGVCTTTKSGKSSVTTDSRGNIVVTEDGPGFDSAEFERDMDRRMDQMKREMDERFKNRKKSSSASTSKSRSSGMNVSEMCTDAGCFRFVCNGELKVRGSRAICNGREIAGERFEKPNRRADINYGSWDDEDSAGGFQ